MWNDLNFFYKSIYLRNCNKNRNKNWNNQEMWKKTGREFKFKISPMDTLQSECGRALF